MNTSELWVIFAQAAIQLDKGAVHAGNEADNLIDEYRKRFNCRGFQRATECRD